MIWAGCMFSQSATGEVSSAYFRKLAHILRGVCKFSQMGQTRAYLCRNTLTVQTCGPQALVKSPQSERGRRPKGCSKARQPMWLCLTSCCRTGTRGRARPVSIREYRSLDLSTRIVHIFAITFTSDVRRAYFRLNVQSFRNFDPDPCIFSLTLPPYARLPPPLPAPDRRSTRPLHVLGAGPGAGPPLASAVLARGSIRTS